jgi:hypothetical protein
MAIKQEVEQLGFMDLDPEVNMSEDWKKEWQGMPEFNQEDLMPWKQITVNFESRSDMNAFAALVRQKITPDTRFIWYPENEKQVSYDKRWDDES